MNIESVIEKDKRISSFLRLNPGQKTLHKIAAFLAHSGDSWFWLAGLVLVALFGNPYWRLRGLILAGSLVVMAVIVLALKFSIRRRRPDGKWGQVYRATDPHSFPSGHAARAFLFATLVTLIGPEWLGVLLLIWAPLVCLARVAMGVHYLSDVLAGMVIGVLSGILIFYLLPDLLLFLQRIQSSLV